MPDPIVQFSLALGVDGKKDARVQPIGTLVTAQNCVYDRLGAVNKRPGNVAQPTATFTPTDIAYNAGAVPSTIPAPSNVGGLFSLGQEQIIASGNRIYGLSPTSNHQVSKDEIPEAVGTRRSISSNAFSSGFYGADVCQTSTGYRAYAWMTQPANGSPVIRIHDAATNALVYSAYVQGVGSGLQSVKLVAIGKYVVFLCETQGGYVFASLYDTSLLGTSAVILVYGPSIITPVGGYGGAPFDACTDGTSLFMAFPVAGTGAAAALTIYQFSVPSFTLVASVAPVPGQSAVGACGIVVNGNAVFATWQNGTGTIYAWNGSTFALVGGVTSTPATLASAPSRLTISVYNSFSQTCIIAYDGVPGVGFGCFGINRASVDATLGSLQCGPYTTSRYLYLACKPVLYQGRMYALLHYKSQTQASYFWCDLEVAIYTNQNLNSVRCVAAIAPRNAIASFPLGTVPSVVADTAGDLFTVCSVIEGSGVVVRSGGSVSQTTRLWETKLAFAAPGRYSNGSIGKSTHVGSSTYDGAQVSELVFYVYPEAITYSAGTGGTLTTGGTYQWVWLYEWVTSSGEIVRSTFCQSSAGLACQLTLSGGQNSATFSNLSPPALTSKSDTETNYNNGVSLSLYRTQAGGTTFNYVASVPPGTTTYTDIASDASIASSPLLYFTPGFQGTVLDYVCPPSSSWTFTTQQRTWILGDDLRTWWYSNAAVEGQQPQFNEGLTLSIQDGNDQVGGVGMDDKIIFFSASAIYYTNGVGPSPTGTGQVYDQPARIQSDVGCIDPRSIVGVPDGVLFLSAKGMVLLDRSLNVTYLDAPTAQLLAYPNVTSAVLFPDRNEVRFALNNGTSGIDLVASYWAPTGSAASGVYRWSWFVKGDPSIPVQGAMSYGAAYMMGSYRWIASSGQPYTEDTTGTVYTDGTASAATWITQWVETSFLNESGPVGWHRTKRVALIGDWYSPHDLLLGVATNYVESYAAPTGNTVTFNANSSSNIQLESNMIHVLNQKNQAIRVSIQDAPPAALGNAVGTGRGFSLAAIGITIMPKAGIGKLTAANRRA